MDFHRLKTPEGGELHREGVCMYTGGGAHTHTHAHMHAGNGVRTEVPGRTVCSPPLTVWPQTQRLSKGWGVCAVGSSALQQEGGGQASILLPE